MSLTSYRAAPPRGEAKGSSGARGVPWIRRGTVRLVPVEAAGKSDSGLGAASAAVGSGVGAVGAHRRRGRSALQKLEAPERVGGRGARLGDDGIKVEETKIVRRRVTDALGRPGSDLLSRVLRRSTIGAEGFHGRVRNGNGLGPLARTTRPAKSIRDENV